MQILLILGIVFAIGPVTFAVQNNVLVDLVFASWHYDISLAVALLVALGVGALIAGLVSTASVIKGQWAVTRLRRQVTLLEREKASLERRTRELESTLPHGSVPPRAATEEVAPYVGMRAIIMAHDAGRPM